MNSTFKTIIYSVLGFMSVFLIITLFLNILPYIILVGLIFYGYFRIKGYFIAKKMRATEDSYSKTYTANSRWTDKVEVDENIVDDVVEVIDVDYKEVK